MHVREDRRQSKRRTGRNQDACPEGRVFGATADMEMTDERIGIGEDRKDGDRFGHSYQRCESGEKAGDDEISRRSRE